MTGRRSFHQMKTSQLFAKRCIPRPTMSRNSGACPVPIDWKFKTSSRHERRLMIEEAYQNYEQQQKEAEEWYRDQPMWHEEREAPRAAMPKKRAPAQRG